MAAMRSEPLGTAICQGLGIPPGMVSCVRLMVKAGDVLRAEVDFYPQITQEQMAQIVAALEEQRTVIDVAMGREAGEYRRDQTF